MEGYARKKKEEWCLATTSCLSGLHVVLEVLNAFQLSHVSTLNHHVSLGGRRVTLSKLRLSEWVFSKPRSVGSLRRFI